MAKLNFQQASIQCSQSHDPSEIILICWFAAQDTFLIIVMLWVTVYKVHEDEECKEIVF